MEDQTVAVSKVDEDHFELDFDLGPACSIDGEDCEACQ